MKLNIDDNARIQEALDKVYEGRYFDALCLFARVDSYESMLNQIGCLCHLNDTGYAVELYRRLLAKYYFTHNCFKDLGKLSLRTVEMLSLFDSALNADEFDESKVSADEKLLADFEGFDEEEYDDFFEEYEEVERESTFCNVKSPEYFFRIVESMQKETEKGNLKKTQALVDELLDFKSDDESVLEGQMLLCLAEHDYERGAEFAERFAALEHADNYRGVAVAVGLLSGSNKHKETLNKMLARLVEFSEQISDNDLMEYVEIAESCFESGELAGKLAEILFERYEYVGCEALRVCARIFCNMGWKKQARDAILTLLNAVPWDCFATVALMFVNSDINAKLDKSFSNLNIIRHLDVPSQLAVVAEYRLIERLEKSMNGNGDECIFYTDDYKLLHCITNVCKTHVYRGNSEKFVNEATVLSTVLTSFCPHDKAEFFEFAKQQLCSFMPEAPVQKDILFRLINLGYRDNLLVSADKRYYPLDLSKLTVSDELFLNAFSLCAVLRRVDVRRLQRSYAKIKATVELQQEFGYDTVHKLAYALLALSYKEFVQSSVAEYFGEGENQLYIDYLTLTSKKGSPV